MGLGGFQISAPADQPPFVPAAEHQPTALHHRYPTMPMPPMVSPNTAGHGDAPVPGKSVSWNKGAWSPARSLESRSAMHLVRECCGTTRTKRTDSPWFRDFSACLAASPSRAFLRPATPRAVQLVCDETEKRRPGDTEALLARNTAGAGAAASPNVPTCSLLFPHQGRIP